VTSLSAPRRLSRRAAFAVTAYAFGVTMMGTTLPTPLYSLYREKFGFSELMVTVIFASYAAGVIAVLLLIGRLSDEIGRRPVLLPGLAFSALSAVVFLLANGLAPLLIGRVLSGFSAGLFTGTATATLVDFAPPRKAGLGTLVATAANILGLGCGPLLAGLLAEYASDPLRLPFWVDLALLVPAALAIVAIPEPVSVKAKPKLRLQALRVPEQVRAIFIRAALAGFAGFAVLGLFTAVSPAFLGQTLHITNEAVIGVVVFAVFAASAVGQFGFEAVPEGLALPAGCGGLIAGMVLLAIGLAAESLAPLVIGGVVAGIGQGLSFRAGLAGINAAAPPEDRAAVASSFFVVAYLALSVPVIGVGLLAEASGLKTAGLVFAGVVAVIAAIVLALLARRPKSG
jgi:predicted MFS family arabinose efflux permease